MLHHNAKDITGARFGRLSVTKVVGRAHGKLLWECLCDCGNIKVTSSSDLSTQRTRSCGCYRRDKAASINPRKYAIEDRVEYIAWRNMMHRCYKVWEPKYKWYGAKGVVVCSKWQTFEGFFEDMGKRPAPGLSLDRINTFGNYELMNCRWATSKEQQNNRRNSKKYIGLIKLEI